LLVPGFFYNGAEQATLEEHSKAEKQRHQHQKGGKRIDPKAMSEEKADQGPQHEELPMGQVENIAHTENQRQTEGSEGVNATQQHTTDEELQ
jgi:hypothetical protein